MLMWWLNFTNKPFSLAVIKLLRVFNRADGHDSATNNCWCTALLCEGHWGTVLVCWVLEEGRPYAMQSLWGMSSLHGRDSWQAGSRGERYHRKMETDGMNTQRPPLTGVKGKKMCYKSRVHLRCTNQRKPEVSSISATIWNNRPHYDKPDIYHPLCWNSRWSPPPSPTHTHHTPTGL